MRSSTHKKFLIIQRKIKNLLETTTSSHLKNSKRKMPPKVVIRLCNSMMRSLMSFQSFQVKMMALLSRKDLILTRMIRDHIQLLGQEKIETTILEKISRKMSVKILKASILLKIRNKNRCLKPRSQRNNGSPRYMKKLNYLSNLTKIKKSISKTMKLCNQKPLNQLTTSKIHPLFLRSKSIHSRKMIITFQLKKMKSHTSTWKEMSTSKDQPLMMKKSPILPT